MMNRLEAPHGVLSRFFRAFEWLRVRGGVGMRWVLNCLVRTASTHVYTWVRIASSGNTEQAVIKKPEMNKHT